MLKKLRLRLTILATCLTGAVLLIMTLVALTISEQGLKNSAETAFQSNINSVILKLQNDQVLASSWLAQMEAAEGLIISISDAGKPLYYSGSWTPQTDREVLIVRTQETGRAQGVDVGIPPLSVIDSSSVTFTVKGDHNDSYLGAVASVPSHGGWQGVTLLKDMSAIKGNILLQRAAFGSMAVFGSVALWFLCWFFTGKAIQPIEENTRRQNEFVAAASHELRSPLAVIRASASAICPESADCPRLRENIEAECVRMARLIDDLLILAGSDAKTWTIHPEAVDIDTLLLETAELFYPVARQRRQHLSLEVPEDTFPLIDGDEQRLKQILSVLLDNAFNYSPEGGTVTLRAEFNSKWVELLVTDTGPGIPTEHLGHIFDRFYRADAARKDKSHFGLGLSIAWELAALHQGKLTVRDTSPKGTTFSVKLPLRLKAR